MARNPPFTIRIEKPETALAETCDAHRVDGRRPFPNPFDMIPVLPPWVWTSTEIDLRRTSRAAEAVSAVCAAAVEPRGPTSPASIALTEVNAFLQINGRYVSACP